MWLAVELPAHANHPGLDLPLLCKGENHVCLCQVAELRWRARPLRGGVLSGVAGATQRARCRLCIDVPGRTRKKTAEGQFVAFFWFRFLAQVASFSAVAPLALEGSSPPASPDGLPSNTRTNTSHESAFLQAGCGDTAKCFVVNRSLHTLGLIFVT